MEGLSQNCVDSEKSQIRVEYFYIIGIRDGALPLFRWLKRDMSRWFRMKIYCNTCNYCGIITLSGQIYPTIQYFCIESSQIHILHIRIMECRSFQLDHFLSRLNYHYVPPRLLFPNWHYELGWDKWHIVVFISAKFRVLGGGQTLPRIFT